MLHVRPRCLGKTIWICKLNTMYTYIDTLIFSLRICICVCIYVWYIYICMYICTCICMSGWLAGWTDASMHYMYVMKHPHGLVSLARPLRSLSLRWNQQWLLWASQLPSNWDVTCKTRWVKTFLPYWGEQTSTNPYILGLGCQGFDSWPYKWMILGSFIVGFNTYETWGTYTR